MDRIYITEIAIKSVRHLKDIKISLSENELKHLIVTGRNGSGKTSLLDAMAYSLNNLVDAELEKAEVVLKLGGTKQLREEFGKGSFILAYYRANRIFRADVPGVVEKVELKDWYAISETPRKDFVKYLLDLKMTEALALAGGKEEKARGICEWFDNFQTLLRRVFDDETLTLEFDEDTFSFHILEEGKEPFDFNTMSSGYSAVLDIVADIMLRMEKQSEKRFQFDMPGIVLIDEIDAHLHLELQREIMNLLTTVFPNIQFVVSTHSPFILNSLRNAVIYDLEKKKLVEDGFKRAYVRDHLAEFPELERYIG